MSVLLRAAAALAVLLLPASLAESAETRLLTMATGEATGMYLPVGGALCRIVAKDRERHGLRCVLEPSSGSVANLVALRAGDVDVAIVQSRAQRQSFRGEAPFADQGAFAEMRSLASLHGESVVALAAKGAKLKALRDAKGRKVSIGRPNSFQRLMAEAVLAGAGLDPAGALEMDVDQQRQALCGGQLDVAFFTGPQPMAPVQEALAECEVEALDLRDAAAEIARKAPFLAVQPVPAGTYDGIDKDLTSVAMKATLVTTTKLPEEVGYHLVKALLDNIEALRQQHPVLAQLDTKAMPGAGMTAPLHPGAARAYKEAGIRAE